MGYLLFVGLAGCITLLLMILGLERHVSAPVLPMAMYGWGAWLVPTILLFWIIRKRANSVKDHLVLLFLSITGLFISGFLFGFRDSGVVLALSRTLGTVGLDLGVAALGALLVFLAVSGRQAIADKALTGQTASARHRIRILVSVAIGLVVGLTIAVPLVLLKSGSDGRRVMGPRAGSSDVLDVLFIGNSLTAARYDIPRNLARLSELTNSSKNVEIQSFVLPAFGLTGHWNRAGALKMIRQGGWDYVVLQENSFEAVLNTDSMHTTVRKFDHEIKKVGARTILYMTWHPRACLRFPPLGNSTVARIGRFFGFRSRWLGRDPVYHLWVGGSGKEEPVLPLDAWLEAYMSIAGELDALVAPVGLAWDLALKRDPSRPLYQKGGNHPTTLGAYLAVCVFYATIHDRSPVGLPSELSLFERDGTERKTIHISESDAQLMQQISWQAIQEQDELVSQWPSPTTAEGWFVLAMVYESEGKTREALDAWKAYLDRNGTKTAIAERHMDACRARLAADSHG